MPTKAESAQLAAALAWKLAKDEFELAQTKEREARAAAVTAVFGDALGAGTTKATLCDGRVLKAVRKAEAKVVDAAKLPAALAALAKAVGKLLAARLVKWTPEASLSEFKKLGDKERALFEAIIEVRAGGPSLELIDP